MSLDKFFNKIAGNDLKKENIIKTLTFLDSKLKAERQGGIFVYSESMSLRKYLRKYEYI